MRMNKIMKHVLMILVISSALAIAADPPPAGDFGVSSSSSGSAIVQVSDASAAAVTVTFAAQGEPPTPTICDLLIGGIDPSNVFTGDLLGAGYSGIRFKVNGDGTQPEGISVVIRQQDGRYLREWVNSRVTVSSVPGEWIITLMPLTREPDWATDFISTKRSYEQIWASDLSAVQAMILRIDPAGSAAQSYSISDFQLVGPGGVSEAANLTPLQAYFGVSSIQDMTPEMYSRDSDGDGMSDYNEILAGMDPHSAASVFAAAMIQEGAVNRINWTGVLGQRYGVMRSNDLKNGFDLIASGLECRATGSMVFEDNSPVQGMPNFYKVVKY